MGYQYRGKIRDVEECSGPKCGSRAGYMEHSRQGTPKCSRCRDAQNTYMRGYRRRPKVRSTCNTYAGYMRHKRAGEDSCEMCLSAYAQYMRDYRNRKVAA